MRPSSRWPSPLWLIPIGLVLFIGFCATPSLPWTKGPLTATRPCRSLDGLPDHDCTPGSVRTVDQVTVCQPGYAQNARHVTDSTKNKILSSYGVSRRMGDFEVDHLIPLALGGSDDPDNLWAQPAEPFPGYHEKDLTEFRLWLMVCSGKRELVATQQAIAKDWISLYHQEFGDLSLDPRMLIPGGVP